MEDWHRQTSTILLFSLLESRSKNESLRPLSSFLRRLSIAGLERRWIHSQVEYRSETDLQHSSCWFLHLLDNNNPCSLSSRTPLTDLISFEDADVYHYIYVSNKTNFSSIRGNLQHMNEYGEIPRMIFSHRTGKRMSENLNVDIVFFRSASKKFARLANWTSIRSNLRKLTEETFDASEKKKFFEDTRRDASFTRHWRVPRRQSGRINLFSSYFVKPILTRIDCSPPRQWKSESDDTRRTSLFSRGRTSKVETPMFPSSKTQIHNDPLISLSNRSEFVFLLHF